MTALLEGAAKGPQPYQLIGSAFIAELKGREARASARQEAAMVALLLRPAGKDETNNATNAAVVRNQLFQCLARQGDLPLPRHCPTPTATG